MFRLRALRQTASRAASVVGVFGLVAGGVVLTQAEMALDRLNDWLARKGL